MLKTSPQTVVVTMPVPQHSRHFLRTMYLLFIKKSRRLKSFRLSAWHGIEISGIKSVKVKKRPMN